MDGYKQELNELDYIQAVIDGINAGKSAEFTKAELIIPFPSTLYLFRADGTQIVIFAIKSITPTGNGYRLNYRSAGADDWIDGTVDIDWKKI